MLEVKGKPLIVHMIDRIQYAKHIEKIIICTSTNSQDDLLEEVALSQGVYCYRGSEDDVLQRLLGAANEHKLDHFANMTADLPMIDPVLIDRTVEEYEKVNADLILPAAGSFCGCKVINVRALEKVCELKNIIDTEVWDGFFKDNDEFNVHTFQIEEKYRHRSLKSSLDYPEDFEFISRVFDELYKPNRAFSSLDIIDLVNRRPDILAINSNPLLLKRWRDHIKKLVKPD